MLHCYLFFTSFNRYINQTYSTPLFDIVNLKKFFSRALMKNFLINNFLIIFK